LQFADCSTKKFADLRLQFNKKKFAELKFLDSHIEEICGFKKHLHTPPLQICQRCQPYWQQICCQCQRYRCHTALDINNTGGKFATSNNGTSGAP
jgi:hypothetical protein